MVTTQPQVLRKMAFLRLNPVSAPVRVSLLTTSKRGLTRGEKEDISIDVKDNQLIISGERSFKEERKENDYYKIESSYGKFQRSFAIPENVDLENIEASSQEGVLEVVLPKLKVEKNEIKKIAVK